MRERTRMEECLKVSLDEGPWAVDLFFYADAALIIVCYEPLHEPQRIRYRIDRLILNEILLHAVDPDEIAAFEFTKMERDVIDHSGAPAGISGEMNARVLKLIHLHVLDVGRKSAP